MAIFFSDQAGNNAWGWKAITSKTPVRKKIYDFIISERSY